MAWLSRAKDRRKNNFPASGLVPRMPTQSRGHGTHALLVSVASGGRWLPRVPCPRLCVGMRTQPPSATAPSHRVPCPRLCVGMGGRCPFRNSPFSQGAMPTALRGHGDPTPLRNSPISSGAMPTALRGHGGTRPGQQQPLRTTGLTPSRLQPPTSPPKSGGRFCGGPKAQGCKVLEPCLFRLEGGCGHSSRIPTAGEEAV